MATTQRVKFGPFRGPLAPAEDAARTDHRLSRVGDCQGKATRGGAIYVTGPARITHTHSDADWLRSLKRWILLCARATRRRGNVSPPPDLGASSTGNPSAWTGKGTTLARGPRGGRGARTKWTVFCASGALRGMRAEALPDIPELSKARQKTPLLPPAPPAPVPPLSRAQRRRSFAAFFQTLLCKFHPSDRRECAAATTVSCGCPSWVWTTVGHLALLV